MRLLLTAHRFWPAVGGTERAVMDLGRALAALGVDVHVATQAEPGLPEEETHEGVTIHRLPVRRRGPFRVPPPAYADLLARPDWDILHLQGQRVWSSDFAYRHLRRARAPRVFTAHGFYQHHMHPHGLVERYYYRRWLPRRLNRFQRVIALTEPEREETVGFGVDADRVVVIPDGVDASEFDRPRENGGFRADHDITADHLLLYAGGLYANKRVGFLLRALAQTDSDVELAIVGRDPTGGRERARLEGLARRLGVPARFLGELPRDDVVRGFLAADLVVLASRFEGYGLVLLEAMAAGTPFISTVAGAAPDLAGAGAGVLATTELEMARAIDDLLADPGRRKRMGAAGKRRAAEQSWEAVARRHHDLYRSLGDR